MNRTYNIGLGTAAIGRPLYINIKQDEKEEAFSLPKFKEDGLKVLEEAYQKGIRFFDTSPGYGLAEQLVVKWLESKKDLEIEVSTKWGYTYVANFDPNATQHEVKEHSLDKLNKQWEYSKMLLPYLKVYQIHSATFDTGVLDNEEVLQRLHSLKKEHGIIIGLTTTGDNQTEVLEKAMNIKIADEPLFESFQCTFNILDQSVLQFEDRLKALKGPFIIKETLANGRLIPNQKFDQYKPLYAYMQSLADKHQVGVDAIALAYCMAVFPNAKVLSGANNSVHLTDNLRANTLNLTEEEIKQLQTFRRPATDYWQERKELSWN